MFSFFGSRKVSKKSTSEREADGGFVIIVLQIERLKFLPILPCKQLELREVGWKAFGNTSLQLCPQILDWIQSFPTPIQQREAIFSRDTSLTNMGDGTSTVETALPAPDLLGIPFTLAPQILALPRGFSCIPDLRLSNDIKSMPMYFQYDFSLERASSSMPDTLRAGAGSPPPPTCSAPGKTRSVPVLLRVRPAPRRGKPAFVGDWRYQIQRPRAQQTCYLNTQPDPHEELRKEIPCGSKSTSSEFSDEDYVPSDSEESDEDPTLWRSPKMNSYGKCKRKKTVELIGEGMG
ncbi:UBAP1-MVB12-associated (UMA)-domain containing protein 1 isoform X4 [Stigmatopora argus]